jgi:hypothetical protein
LGHRQCDTVQLYGPHQCPESNPSLSLIAGCYETFFPPPHLAPPRLLPRQRQRGLAVCLATGAGQRNSGLLTFLLIYPSSPLVSHKYHGPKGNRETASGATVKEGGWWGLLNLHSSPASQMAPYSLCSKATFDQAPIGDRVLFGTRPLSSQTLSKNGGQQIRMNGSDNPDQRGASHLL